MSLKNRLILYINSLLVVAMIVGITGVMFAAKKNVRDEILSTQSLAVFAIENGIKKNPDFYLFQEEGESFGFANLNQLRHLRIQFFDTQDNLIDSSQPNIDKQNSAPKFIEKIMTSLLTSMPSKIIPIDSRGKSLGYILIKPDPAYEINEIWQQVKSGLIVILIFFIFINLVIYFVFFHTLQPINELLDGFKKLENENYKVRINKTNISELNNIGQKFNSTVKKIRETNMRVHKLSQDLINIQEQEKKELARNLHDELGQSLTAIQAEAASIKNSKKGKSQLIAVDNIINLSKSMMLSTRELIKKLSLGILDEVGIQIALDDLIVTWNKRNPKVNLQYDLDHNTLRKISKDHHSHIYRIVQEALTNISKHANPLNVSIMFKTLLPGKIKIEIINDGLIKKTQDTSGMGLSGIQERVAQMQGQIKVTSSKLFKIIILLKHSKR
jgi:two-component system sensor histidine kinase UhpB